MFEIKLTKETAIANVLRQMMGISKENMDTKMEYLKKVLNEYESDGLDLREHVGAFGIREITDKKSLAKHINIIIKDCKHSANLISIEFFCLNGRSLSSFLSWPIPHCKNDIFRYEYFS